MARTRQTARKGAQLPRRTFRTTVSSDLVSAAVKIQLGYRAWLIRRWDTPSTINKMAAVEMASQLHKNHHFNYSGIMYSSGPVHKVIAFRVARKQIAWRWMCDIKDTCPHVYDLIFATTVSHIVGYSGSWLLQRHPTAHAFFKLGYYQMRSTLRIFTCGQVRAVITIQALARGMFSRRIRRVLL